MVFRIWPGKPYPRGATFDGNGTNFSLFSENATAVELHLFNCPGSTKPNYIIPIKEKTAHAWHCYLPDVKAGQLYGYKVYGPYQPEMGHRFNPNKLLVDPYAKAIAGVYKWDDTTFGYRIGDEKQDLSFDDRDSTHAVPESVVIDSRFNWEGDKLLQIPWNETVIYETHVKGMTKLHSKIKENLRGTFAGLASSHVLEHLKNLGITAVELLPIQQHIDDRLLKENGLVNYWGYNTIGFFAPDCRYSSSGNLGGQVKEFKEMVKAFHQNGIEIIMDVVYNHTAEGNQLGPTLCFRGIDNASYYNLSPENPRYYMDFSGCGGCFNLRHPRVLQFIMDSLRYWVLEMHVDGFRFDLAATLAREFFHFDKLSTFFDIIAQDPILSQVKLIAEPWDIGPGGYRVGNFPYLWSEWNGKYRDAVRKLWKGEDSQLSEFAYRITGSSDLYQGDERKPSASINFITCHDGFSLNDLVSYNEKHNEPNKENNKDGENENHSWNCGFEGKTDNPEILQLRQQQKKNFLVTLLLSQGVPMILGGDEMGRTQQGNNNTYCQDNELSWLHWDIDSQAKELLTFSKKLIHFRKAHHIFRRKHFFQGRSIHGTHIRDIIWLKLDGSEMKEQDWQQSFIKTLGIFLAGDGIDDVDLYGNKIIDDSFLILINSHYEEMIFTIPNIENGWNKIMSTDTDWLEKSENLNNLDKISVKPRTITLLISKKKIEKNARKKLLSK